MKRGYLAALTVLATAAPSVWGFRQIRRNLMAFEYLEDRNCASARWAIQGTPYDTEVAEIRPPRDAECKELCEAHCPAEPTFDIVAWRKCLLGIGMECQFRPHLWIAAPLADNNPTSRCRSASNATLGLIASGQTSSTQGDMPMGVNLESQKSIRFFVPDELMEKCQAAKWTFSYLAARTFECDAVEEGSQGVVVDDAIVPVVVRDRLSNGYLFIRTEELVKGASNLKFYITTDVPECLDAAYDERNWIGSPRFVGARGQFWQTGYKYNNTDLALDQRNSFYIGRTPYGFELE